MGENKNRCLSLMLAGTLLATMVLPGCDGKTSGKAEKKSYAATADTSAKIDSVRAQMKKPSLSGAACCAGSPSRGAALSKAGPGTGN